MRVQDINIVIHEVQPDNKWLRVEVMSQLFAASQATSVEVLGWHRITPEDQNDLVEFLAAGTLLSLSDGVADRAVELRQKRKMSLGDAFIAATALEHHFSSSAETPTTSNTSPVCVCSIHSTNSHDERQLCGIAS